MPAQAGLPGLQAKLHGAVTGMALTGQVASSFVAVVLVYWVYWFVAVPLIEPSLEERVTTPVTEEEIREAQQKVSSRQRDVAQYFGEGCWELDSPAVWQSDQTRLLFKTLTPKPDGSVELMPCTVLFFPKAGAAAQQSTKPIIMRAVEGAIVKFDQPIVLKNVDLAKRELVGGRLVGPIHIYRDASHPGASDELEITTHDVELLKDRAFTPHPVNFRLGRNHGSGRELEIMLGPAEGANPSGGFRNGNVRSLELRRDVKMQMMVGGTPLATPGGAPAGAPEPPVEITCQGPFHFDMAAYAASFRDYVNVFRTIAGESDQMTCELLTVYFQRGGAAAPSTPKPAAGTTSATPISAMNVRLIEARGDPVIVRSPSQGIYVHCRGLDYAPAPGGAVGKLVALGPGVLQGNLPSSPLGKYDASWSREFRFEPDGQQHRASLNGNAAVRFAGMGNIKADEIAAWVTPVPEVPVPKAKIRAVSRPVSDAGGDGATAQGNGEAQAVATPAARGSDRWQLERILALVNPDQNGGQRAVVIDTPQLHGVTGRLEANVLRPQVDASAASANSATAAPSAPPASKSKPTQPNQRPTERFDVRAGTIAVELAPQGKQYDLSGLAMVGQAHLEQISLVKPGEKPLVVDGQRLNVAGANTEATRVTVVGHADKPGLIQAGGMSLMGPTIEMEKQTNHLWINGPGRMTMPLDQDLNGQALKKQQMVDITWQGSMDFLANAVVYHRSVLVKTESQTLTTEKLEAVLSRPIDFANARAPGAAGGKGERPELAHVRCYGPAVMTSFQLDEQGQLASRSELHAADLTVNRLNGDLAGAGPGWVIHRSRGSDQKRLGPPGAGAKPAQPAAQGGANANKQITYLHVQFQSTIDGNINRRVIRFGDPTKTVYGPVADWNATLNADDPASVGPQGLVMDARHLELREMAARNAAGKPWFEIKASGNVLAEGSQFTARGDQLTYSEEKEQLVLRGDGYSPAEFFQDDPKGGQRRESKAQEITYWVALARVQVAGFQAFDAIVPGKQPTPGKAKPKAAAR